MADSTPLLSEPKLDTNEPPKLVDHKVVPDNSIDSIIEKVVGDKFNWALFLQAVLISFAWFFDAQQSFISIFADANPAWHCEAQLNRLGNETCSSVSDICKLPRDSWAWNLPAKASTISEWGLHCSESLVKGMPASAFFLGSFLGGLTVTTLADSLLGRKRMLVLSCMGMSVSALLTAFSTNVWMYSALRFLSGFSRTAIGTCALVLPTELVGKKWRGQVGVIGFLFFTLGFLSLPAIAYSNRGSSWRNLYIGTSIPTIIYCLAIHFLVSESPRWLFIRGRQEEAIETLKAMAPTHDDIHIYSSDIIKILSNIRFDQQDFYSAIKILVAKKWALRRLLAVMALGFGVGLAYYGMPLALGKLDLSLYLSVTFNALSEIPASLATYYLVAKMDRKTSILVLTISSCIFSIMSISKGQGLLLTRLQIVFELVSFFGACTAFDLLLIFAVELFPTSVRNSAVSMVRQASVLGGVVAPLLTAAGRGDRGILSYGVFGAAIGLFGLFVLCLPETRGTALCDTMDDEERREEAAKYHSTLKSTDFVV